MQTRRSAIPLLLIMICSLFQGAAAAEMPRAFDDLVANLSRVAVHGAPGPLLGLDTAWVSIAAGDEDTSPPAAVVAARHYGKGRIVAVGHEGLLRDESLRLHDTKRLVTNMLAWLAPTDPKRVLFSTRHAEWITAGTVPAFRKEAAQRGYTVGNAPAPLTRNYLDGAGVLVVGNAWDGLSEAEIGTLKEFVQKGGGLLLTGLGWSWANSHPNQPLADYPMNRVGAAFGIQWPAEAISDPTDSEEAGWPVFHTFFPAAVGISAGEGFARLEQLCASHPEDLPTLLEKDPELRAQFSLAASLSVSLVRMRPDESAGQSIYDGSKGLVTSCPQYFAAEPTFDPKASPTMRAARDRILSAWVLALPFDETVRDEFAAGARLNGLRLEIWNRFGIHLTDNNTLTTGQLTVIRNTLNLIPQDLHHLRLITVVGAGENAFANRDGVSIGIFNLQPGEMVEKALPPEAAGGTVDVFSSALIHEINHCIDFHTILANEALRTRRDQLLTAAGKQDLQYLRSMIGATYFQEHPAEFVASLSNAWFADSNAALMVSLARFGRGYREPLHQVLLMADLYSQGSDVTYFYRNDTQGRLTLTETPLIRDRQGRIAGIKKDGVIVQLTWADDGTVAQYRIR